jgi:hypothetical protein
VPWRSTLPAGRPVTIHYSELMADLLARLRAVPDWSPALLNTRLWHSQSRAAGAPTHCWNGPSLC